MIQFFVACTPRGKARARILRSGRSYTPKTTVDLEQLIGWECKKAMSMDLMDLPLEGPVWLTVEATFAYPKAFSRKQRENTHWKTSKPDLDNIVKLVDALNGIAWADDAQVARLDCKKVYGEKQGLLISFGELE